MSELAPKVHLTNTFEITAATSLAAVPTEVSPVIPVSPETPQMQKLYGGLGGISLNFLRTPADKLALGVNSARQAWNRHVVEGAMEELADKIEPAVIAMRSSSAAALEQRAVSPDLHLYRHEEPATTTAQDRMHRRMWRERTHMHEEFGTQNRIGSIYGRPVLKPEAAPPKARPAPVAPGSNIDKQGRRMAPTRLSFTPKEARDSYEREVVLDEHGEARTRSQIVTDGDGMPVRDARTQRALTERVPVTKRSTDIGTPGYEDRIERTPMLPAARKQALREGRNYAELSHEIHERQETLSAGANGGRTAEGRPVKGPWTKLVTRQVALETKVTEKSARLTRLQQKAATRRQSIADRKTATAAARASRTTP